MRAQLLHLSGPLRGQTITYQKPRLLIGSAPDADVRLTDVTPVVPRHAELTFHEEGCAFHLQRLDGAVFVNQQEIDEVILQPGDLLEIGNGGPKARFRLWAEPGAVCKPVRQMLGDAREVGRNAGAVASSRSLLRDLLTHASIQLKVGVPLLALLVLLPLAYAAGWLGGGQVGPRLTYGAQLDAVRHELEALKAAKAQAASRQEVDELRAEFARRAAIVDGMTDANRALKRVLAVYSKGVCLLHGTYAFTDPHAAGAFLEGSDGERLEFEYLGSGFLADQQGHVVTNRHIAEPWWHDRDVVQLLRMGYQPRFLALTATFPGHEPLAVDTDTVSLRADEIDVAVVHVDLGERDVPVLPMSTVDPTRVRGEHVVVLGYPTGLNAMLARMEPAVARELMPLRTDFARLIAEMARRRLITPLATQGALNDVLEYRLVYDANTTSGGSGGPVFGMQGTVIGVNFAIMSDFDASNFGVPIRFALELLP